MKDIRVITDPKIRSEWNKRATHPLQSWEWGEARQEMGIDVLRIGEFQNDHLTDVFQLTIHKIPKTSYNVGYLPRSVIPTEEILSFLYQYGKRNNIISIKLEPNVKADHVQIPKQVQDDKHVAISPTPLFPKWTQTISLEKSEDELLKQMKPKTRYNVKLAQKKGVTVKENTSSEGFETFIKLYFETTKRQHYFGHDKHYHKVVFSTLRKNISHILIAEYKNTPLAAYELFLFNDVLYYPYGGSSTEYKDVMAPNLIMWEAIRFGKKHGAKSFDLWGSLSADYDKNHIWAGFTRFKEGYGAEFTEMIGSYDLVINPLLYKIFILTQKIREKFLS